MSTEVTSPMRIFVFSLQAEYTFTPTASGTYNAQFVKEAGTPVTYKITATASPAAGGTATVNGKASVEVEANGTIELSAKANDGYTFVNWTNGGKESQQRKQQHTIQTINLTLV